MEETPLCYCQVGIEIQFPNSASISTKGEVRTLFVTTEGKGEFWPLTRPPLISPAGSDRITLSLLLTYIQGGTDSSLTKMKVQAPNLAFSDSSSMCGSAGVPCYIMASSRNLGCPFGLCWYKWGGSKVFLWCFAEVERFVKFSALLGWPFPGCLVEWTGFVGAFFGLFSLVFPCCWFTLSCCIISWVPIQSVFFSPNFKC